MGCSVCSDHRKLKSDEVPAGCGNKGHCASGGCNKLNSFSWFSDHVLGEERPVFPWAEVRFKNTRKEFFLIPEGLRLRHGDTVCTEGSPGVDVGIISLIGPLVKLQMDKLGFDPAKESGPRKILRLARQADIERWQKAIAREPEALEVAREVASEAGLNIKISDVEFQGDGTKVIVYFLSEERVDFREMVRQVASRLQARVEMRQIGARQEAGLVGGLGSCGRELCCSTWLRDFRTVNTGAVRYQFLSINSEKLAGQCGKLKCCLNYELDMYLEALRTLPPYKKSLEFEQGKAQPVKVDIFKRQITYECQWSEGRYITLGEEEIRNILKANQEGQKPPAPEVEERPFLQRLHHTESTELDFILEEETTDQSPEEPRKKKKKKRKKRASRGDAPQASQS